MNDRNSLYAFGEAIQKNTFLVDMYVIAFGLSSYVLTNIMRRNIMTFFDFLSE